MPTHKKQHYLPAAYLRNFSVDGPRSTRKSQIWRTDVRGRRLVSVESQGFADYHYSQMFAEQVEKEFQVGEDFYGGCYADFWQRNEPSTRRKAFGLLVLMLDLHIRNAAYAKASRNNHEDYLAMSATVKYRILWGKRSAPADDQAIVDEACRNWQVRFIKCAPNRDFLTSDHPSVLAKVGSGSSFANLVLMPVTPKTYAVGFDAREFDVRSGLINEADESILTQLQVKNCVQCVYTRENISDTEWAGFKILMARRQPRKPVEGPGRWGADIFQIPKRGGLGFLNLG